MELLAPAGNPEALKAAIYSGANAVYFGLNKFNARINANNFNKENVREYIELCHLHGVKAYITFNTIIKDNEFEEFEESVKVAAEAKADAFIVTDLGALSIFAKYDVPLHASTQMGIHNLDGAKFVEKLGFTRVVVSRETLFEDIKEIKENTSLEVEYFVHGALCVSFSGGCLLSSFMTGTSGNRGLCKQPCRLCYESSLSGENKYYLSPADQCLIDKIDDLKKIGIDSLKIEGRLKSSYYVGEVTKVYREALDGKKDPNYLSRLYRAYNRGHFTSGYNYDNTLELMSIDVQNNIGEVVGKIVKRYGPTMEIQSSYEFKIGDGIKIINNGKEIGGFGIDNVRKLKDGIYAIKTVKDYPVGAEVHLTQEKEMVDRYENVDLKLPINIDAIVSKDGLQLTASYKDINISKAYDIVSNAKNNPTTIEELEEKLKKSSENFKIVSNIKIQDKGLFVPMSAFNKSRRDIVDALRLAIIEKHENNMLRKHISKAYNAEDEKLEDAIYEINDSELIDEYSKKGIVVLNILDYTKIKDIDGKVYIKLPKIARGRDKTIIENVFNKYKDNIIGVVADNIYGIEFARQRGLKIIGGPGLNIFNSQSSKWYGLNNYVMSVELKRDELIDGYSLEINKNMVMTLTHCPIQLSTKCTCSTCKYKNDVYYNNGSLNIQIERVKVGYCYFNLFIPNDKLKFNNRLKYQII